MSNDLTKVVLSFFLIHLFINSNYRTPQLIINIIPSFREKLSDDL